MRFRSYNSESDSDAAVRIWSEVGWIDHGKDEHRKAAQAFIGSGASFVAEHEGQAECLVSTHDGSVFHQSSRLPLLCVTGVTTGRLLRRQGVAGRLTAHAISHEVARQKSAVAGLGIFDQGYYNKMGFGGGPYEHRIAFDPSDLIVKDRPRIPIRLSTKDSAAMHACRLDRRPRHGRVLIHAPAITSEDTRWNPGGFGLGYRDGANGALTHYIWMCVPNASETGPYRIEWLVWNTRGQFLELLGLLKSLGDQVHTINMVEPADIQMQDFLSRPFRRYTISRGGEHQTVNRAAATWQMRICDMHQCIDATHLDVHRELNFNLELSDPIASYLDDDAPWNGVQGQYIVTFGQESTVSDGTDPELPTLRASVNAFTRLWLGVTSATALSISDDLRADVDLLQALDSTLRLPCPKPDWEY